jgi:hypothetical protein
MAKKSKTKSEREYLGLVAALGCAICRRLGYGETPAEVHHPRDGMGVGMRGAHTDAIPLCYPHHRTDIGFHGMGKKAFEREYKVTERELVEETKQLIRSMA